jgi:DNA-binding response OmpR family regulator
MEDNNAAHTTPVGGNMGSLNGTTAHKVDISVQNRLEGQHTTQRILLVEDDLALAALEAEFLTAHGYTVVTVHSGERAIMALRHSLPDLVVLDLELTGSVNGWDVLQALRTSATIPVLLTTSSATAVRTYKRTHGETKFTLDHLPKPYPMQTLLKRVKRMLTIAPQSQ